MAEPIIGGKDPIEIEVVAGETYWWCRCGRSAGQPFCDGSHEGTGIEPLEFTAKGNRKLRFCTCKLTRKPPYCDDSHLTLT